MALRSLDDFDGPIPGENFTSDTKNYPWHRPAKFKELDDAIEHSVQHLTKKNNVLTLLTMIKSGIPLNVLARTYVISGVGSGKWTVDFAILMAGPVLKIMSMMADGAKIKYDLGLEEGQAPTLPMINFLAQADASKIPDAVENIDVDEVKQEANDQSTESLGGFMSRRAQMDDSDELGDDVDTEGNM